MGLATPAEEELYEEDNETRRAVCCVENEDAVSYLRDSMSSLVSICYENQLAERGNYEYAEALAWVINELERILKG